MLTESEVCQRLFAFLKNKGYPEDAMAFEYVLGTQQSKGGEKRHSIVDAAILDVSTGMPLVFLEVKTRVDDRVVSHAIRQLRTYAARIEMPIKMYFVVPNDEHDWLKIADVSSAVYADKNSETGNRLIFWEGSQLDKEFPSYDLLIKGAANKLGLARESDAVRKLDKLKVVSYVVDGVLFALFLIDFIAHRWSLRWENLAVLGVAVIVSLAPYYEGVRYNGLAIFQKKTDKSTSD